MLRTPDFMREMRRGEEADVDALLMAAYGNDAACKRVGGLRKSRAIAGEMVLPMEGAVIGYAALSKMVAPKGWLALGPVAILPEHQGRGFGKRLVGMIAGWAEMSGQTLAVEGAPALMARCGFRPHETALIIGAAKAKDTRLTFPFPTAQGS